jgi:hypothetical protein
MKIKHSRDVDILLVELAPGPVDYAEETDGVITHFSADGKPLVLEIQGATEFLLSSLASLLKEDEVGSG